MKPTVPTIQLGELELLSSGYQPGGFSKRIMRVTAGLRTPGLYKEYTPEKRRELNVSSLQYLVRWRQDLPHDVREFLDLFCAYPRVVVLEGRDVAGIVMDEAPAEFIQKHPAREPTPRQADVLGRRRDRAREPDAPYFEPPHKLALLGTLLDRMIWMHDRHLVVGDLQPSNILVTSGTTDREVYFIDCDSFWLGDLHAFPPHSPYMWDVGTDYCSPATDLAKFARLVVRALCDNFSMDYFPAEKLHEFLPSHHVRQLERMWSVDPSFATVKLRSMAYSWTKLVRSAPGRPTRMYLETDRTGRIPWPLPGRPADLLSAVRIPAGSAASPAASGATRVKHMTAHRATQPTTTYGRRDARTRIMVAVAIVAVLVVLALLAWTFKAFAAGIRPAGLGPSRICAQVECSSPPRPR
jgi:hypothetical protein